MQNSQNSQRVKIQNKNRRKTVQPDVEADEVRIGLQLDRYLERGTRRKDALRRVDENVLVLFQLLVNRLVGQELDRVEEESKFRRPVELLVVGTARLLHGIEDVYVEMIPSRTGVGSGPPPTGQGQLCQADAVEVRIELAVRSQRLIGASGVGVETKRVSLMGEKSRSVRHFAFLRFRAVDVKQHSKRLPGKYGVRHDVSTDQKPSQMLRTGHRVRSEPRYHGWHVRVRAERTERRLKRHDARRGYERPFLDSKRVVSGPLKESVTAPQKFEVQVT